MGIHLWARAALRTPQGWLNLSAPEPVRSHAAFAARLEQCEALYVAAGALRGVDADDIPDDTQLSAAEWNAKVDAVLADAQAWIVRQEGRTEQRDEPNAAAWGSHLDISVCVL